MTDWAIPVKQLEDKSMWVLLFCVVEDDEMVVVVEKWWLVVKSENRE